MKRRFRRSFWGAERACILIGLSFMSKNTQNSIFGFYQFCKKNFLKMLRSIFFNSSWMAMVKNHLKSYLPTFISFIWIKAMNIHSNNSRTRDHLIQHIKMKRKEINQDVVIKTFDNLKEWVHGLFKMGCKALWNSEIDYLRCL